MKGFGHFILLQVFGLSVEGTHGVYFGVARPSNKGDSRSLDWNTESYYCNCNAIPQEGQLRLKP